MPWSEFDALLAQVIDGGELASVGWAEFATLMSSYRLWKGSDRTGARRTARQRPGALTDTLLRWYDHLEGRAASSPPAVEGR